MSILYPEYLGEPDTWSLPGLRPVEERFLKELASVSTVDGKPRFRLIDATKEEFFYEGDKELEAGHYLKYPAMLNVRQQDGYMYADGEGWKKTSRAADVPDGKLAIPNYTYRNFGIPRYMVEVLRVAGEPGVDETGYVFAWTIDVKQKAVIKGEPVEISHYRHPSAFDLEHARMFDNILKKATKESNRLYAEKKAEAREKREAEAKQLRREERAEATERFIRNELL